MASEGYDDDGPSDDAEVVDGFEDDFEPLSGSEAEGEDGGAVAQAASGQERGRLGSEPPSSGELSGAEFLAEASDSSAESAPPLAPHSSGRAKAASGRHPPSEKSATLASNRPLLVVPDQDRRTSNRMTVAEMARAIALRASHLEANPSPYIKVGQRTSPAQLAHDELFARRSPLLLYRTVGRSSKNERIVEVWPVREMAYPPISSPATL